MKIPINRPRKKATMAEMLEQNAYDKANGHDNYLETDPDIAVAVQNAHHYPGDAGDLPAAEHTPGEPVVVDITVWTGKELDEYEVWESDGQGTRRTLLSTTDRAKAVRYAEARRLRHEGLPDHSELIEKLTERVEHLERVVAEMLKES